MIELERLKELKFQEDKEKEAKLKKISSAKILIDQIKEKEIRRLQEKEIIAREGELMKKQIKALQDEELRNEERKRLENARLAKEIVNINKISALNRDKKKLLEKEEDLKRLKYNMEKAKKEEEELAEQKRIQAARERETKKGINRRKWNTKIGKKKKIGRAGFCRSERVWIYNKAPTGRYGGGKEDGRN